jgi:hypothetical protein
MERENVLKSFAVIVCLGALVTSPLASEPVHWTFQASASAGAAVVASRGNTEFARLGCRRGDQGEAVELFVLSPGPRSAAVQTLRMNELVVPLSPSNGAGTAPLLAGHFAELRRLQDLELQLELEEVVELPVATGGDVFEQLADACQALAGFEDHRMQWFLTADEAGAQLGFGAIDSEFVGPAFRCADDGTAIEVGLPAPPGAPARIRLRSGDVSVDIPATAEASVLYEGNYLRGTIARDHPFWQAFARTGVVEAPGSTGESESFGTAEADGAAEEFLEICARQ